MALRLVFKEAIKIPFNAKQIPPTSSYTLLRIFDSSLTEWLVYLWLFSSFKSLYFLVKWSHHHRSSYLSPFTTLSFRFVISNPLLQILISFLTCPKVAKYTVASSHWKYSTYLLKQYGLTPETSLLVFSDTHCIPVFILLLPIHRGHIHKNRIS